MPKGTYKTPQSAEKMQNYLKKTKCDAVKLENNKNNFKIIELLVKKNCSNGTYRFYTSIFKKFKVQRT